MAQTQLISPILGFQVRQLDVQARGTRDRTCLRCNPSMVDDLSLSYGPFRWVSVLSIVDHDCKCQPFGSRPLSQRNRLTVRIR